MGFFSDVVGTVTKPIKSIFGGGGTTVTTGQTSKQNIDVVVNPATDVRVYVPETDLTPIARGIETGYLEFSQAVGEFGEQVYRGQLALTSAAEREAQTEAEKILQDKQEFAWIKQTGKKIGGFSLIVAGAVVFIYAATRK